MKFRSGSRKGGRKKKDKEIEWHKEMTGSLGSVSLSLSWNDGLVSLSFLSLRVSRKIAEIVLVQV
jgi:hypothetical protein